MFSVNKQNNSSAQAALDSPSNETKTYVQDITKKSNAMGSDIINCTIGNFGVWQLRTILIVFLCKIPASWFMACIIFTAPELYPQSEFVCVKRFSNQTVTSDQCDIHCSKNELMPCEQFRYFSKFQSLIMEFDLVCSRDILLAWTQYWHLFGILAGGVAATQMMKYISPRNVYAIGMVAQIFCGIITGYARDFSLHCAFRCLSAVCCALMFTSGQAIFVDLTAGVYRTGALILYDTFWSIGVIYLPGLAWFFKSWTGIYMGITFPTICLLLLLKWTPESPRWLLKHSKSPADIDKVERMLREGAKINERTSLISCDFRMELESLSESLQSQTTTIRWMQLWSGTRAKIHMVAAHMALACFIINFMGMLLNLRSFGRDYLVPNTIAMGFSEIIGCFIAFHFTMKHNKWKWQLAGVLNIVSGGIGCLGWILSASDSMNATLKTVLWMVIAVIPKAGVSCAQSMLTACMGELVPANKKILFTFSVVTWARIWLLTAPFFNVLKKIDIALSLTSYSCLSIIGGLFTCLLITPHTSEKSAGTPLESLTPKEQSPLTKTAWTIEDDSNNTSL